VALCLAMIRQILFPLARIGAGNAFVRILHLLFFLKVPCCSIVFLKLMLRGEGHLANLAIVAFFFKDRCVPISVSFVDSLDS